MPDIQPEKGRMPAPGLLWPSPWWMRSLMQTASSFLTMAVTRGDLTRNSVSVGISSSPPTFSSTSRQSTLLQSSTSLSRHSSSLARRSLTVQSLLARVASHLVRSRGKEWNRNIDLGIDIDIDRTIKISFFPSVVLCFISPFVMRVSDYISCQS